MKKSQKTILTSAILSMAAAAVNMNSDCIPVDSASAMAPVYGPPPSYYRVKGDLNDDGAVNIADVCLMKNTTENNSSSYTSIYDVNEDDLVNGMDYQAVRNYFLGITPDMLNKQPDLTQPVYGTPVTVTTPPVVTTRPQPVYGTFPTQPPVTQPAYGTFPTQPPVTQPVYGTFPTFTTPTTTIETVYGPPPSVPTEDDD